MNELLLSRARGLVTLGVYFILLVGCSGGGSSSTPPTSSSSAIEPTTLLNVPGFGIVTDVASIDLNSDGNLDLIVARTRDNPFYSGLYLQALINNGDKTFTDQTQQYFPNLGNNWKWIDKIYFADLNGDSRLDLVLHTDINAINLPPLIRQPNGSFAPIDPLLLSISGPMVPIDADADGDMDLLVHTIEAFGNSLNQQIQWSLLVNTLANTGTMSFQAGNTLISNNKGWDYSAFVYAPVIKDINNDGRPDILFGGPKWKNGGFINEVSPLTVYTNSGNGQFTENANLVFAGSVPSLTHVRDTAVADFNGDGLSDIVIANTGYDLAPFPGERNHLLLQQANGTLLEQPGGITDFNYKGFTHSTAVGDIDNDGDVDIVFTDILGDDVIPAGKIRILLNNGSGVFSKRSATVPTQYLNSNGWTSTNLVDLNKDGYPELILGGIDFGSESFIFWNDGKGNFQ